MTTLDWWIVAGGLFLALVIRAAIWFTEPRRIEKRARRIGALWAERERLRWSLETRNLGSQYFKIIRDRVEDIDDELEALGVPQQKG